MKVSVAVITYNHEQYIEQALLSVIAQYHNNLYDLEIIVSDDASKDNTLQIVNRIKNAHKGFDIRILANESNLGLYGNLKRCLEIATGDYIAILEGDDYYLNPFKLLKQIEFLEKHRDCAMCSHSYLEYNMNTGKYNTINYQQDFEGEKYCFEDLVVEYKWTNFSTYMYRKEYIKNLKEYVWTLKGADYGFNINMALNGFVGVIKEPLSVYRVGHGIWSSLSLIEQQEKALYFDKVNKKIFYNEYGNQYDDIFNKRIKKSIKNLKRVKAKVFKNKIRNIFNKK